MTVKQKMNGTIKHRRGNEEHKGKYLLRKIIRNRQIYLMLVPVLAFYIVYCYVPMYGIVLAWKDYRPKFGITGSPWLGWENFEYLFSLPDLPRAIKNTLAISFLKLCICFPMPILFALLLNELRHPKYKKTVQTCIYLPNFISWVIIGSLIRMSLAYDDGLINNIIAALGGQRVGFLLEADYFYAILISAEVWKGTLGYDYLYCRYFGNRPDFIRGGDDRRLQARRTDFQNYSSSHFTRHYRYVYHAAFQYHECGIRFGL